MHESLEVRSENQARVTLDEGSALDQLLDRMALDRDDDRKDDSADDRPGVRMMTLHAAKGLEFPVVYLIAVEQNLIPHERSLRENDARQLEEERRLLFVGITRAEAKLVLTHTLRREIHGRSLSTIPSDFLEELAVESRDCTGAEDFQFGDFTEDDFGADSFDAHDTGHDEDASFDRKQFLDSSRSRSEPNRGQKSYDSPSRSLPSSLRLTTGAALEAGTKQGVELPLGFAVGMQVRHPRYGLGTVIETSGLAKNRTVTVEFVSEARRESFMASKCPLQPIGLR